MIVRTQTAICPWMLPTSLNFTLPWSFRGLSTKSDAALNPRKLNCLRITCPE